MADSGPFEFGPFRLDTEKSVLWRSGKLVPLTPKALGILQVLVEHRGDVVSKQELLGRVWPDAAVEEANLSVAVAAIRRALGHQPDGRSYVETVSRRGYRFDAPLRDRGAGPQLGLAVLPFSCLGMESDEHLGIGLADALIGRLTEVDGLRVPPTAAVVQYAIDPKPPRQAAKELGVDAVLTGTIQRHEGRLRVSVQLTPLPAALRPWADSFDGDWTDLFAVQDELAERVGTGAFAPAHARARRGSLPTLAGGVPRLPPRPLSLGAVRSREPGEGVRVLRRGPAPRPPLPRGPFGPRRRPSPPRPGRPGRRPATRGTSRRSAPSMLSPSTLPSPTLTCHGPMPASSGTGTGRGAAPRARSSDDARPGPGLRASLARALPRRRR